MESTWCPGQGSPEVERERLKKPIPFGKYLLLERINVGGMAEVFLARSRGVHGFKRLLAIKKILPTMAEDKEFIAMFIDEARIAAELTHASIVQIYELGKFRDDYYIAMEFVHGKDLRYIQERMMRERQPMPLNLAVFIVWRICEALDYAHSKRDPSGKHLGIIHRDVSPQNVIISYEGEIKICDFGIAKAANRSQKTQAGVLKGKFGYMSPEQVRGLPLDGRSDIFTVGTLLYEMVTLQRLFLGESDFSTLEKVRNADVVPPSTYNHDVPEELEGIILRALAKEVEDRFQNAAEFADALQQFLMAKGMTSARDLGGFVKDAFRSEFDAEMKRIEFYQNLPDAIVAQAEREERQAREVQGAPPEEADENEKTLIFTSHEEAAVDAGKGEAAEARVDLAEARTMIFGDGKEPAGELADAHTMIFSESVADVHEAPTRGLQRPEPAPPRRQPPAGDSGSAGRWLVVLAVACALLLGWSSFVTVRLYSQARQPRLAALELVSEPAVGLSVKLDGKPVASLTPFVATHLEPGEHLLQVDKRGYQSLVRKVKLRPGTRLVLDVMLRRLAVPPGRPPASLPVPKVAGGGSAPGAKVGAAPAPGKATPGETPRQKAPGAGTSAPAPAPAAATAAPPPARLVLESTPAGAAVYAGNRRLGVTPLELERSSGRKLVLVFRKKGYREARRSIVPVAGRDNPVRVTLERRQRQPVVSAAGAGNRPDTERGGFGFLVANTRPWSKVYIDGHYTGRDTPIPPDKKLKLKAGKHKIIFETSAGKRYVFEVVIEADKTTKLIKKLEG